VQQWAEMDYIRAELAKTSAVMNALASDPEMPALIGEIAGTCIAAIKRGNKVLFCGNGGSAADAQHLAAELVSRFAYDRPGLQAFALTTDSSVMTAIGNDYGYEHVFARQIGAVGAKGDVLVAISTSGRSPNILAALRAARERGLATVGFTGRKGGDFASLCDIVYRVPSDETPKIQEGHIVVGHIVCGLVERALFPPAEIEPARRGEEVRGFAGTG
jgi:D-sedoheptulose 7-phosphate isomerase